MNLAVHSLISRAILVVLVGAFSALSCTSANMELKVTYIDNDSFNYNILRLQSLEDETFIVLVKKDSSHVINDLPTGLVEIQLGGTYFLTLEEFDSPPELVVMLRGRLSRIENYIVYHEIYDGDESNSILFWANRVIQTRVFHSDNIQGRFIRMNR